jgi:pyruvate/2-oxoglutarate dehydrogenase complex dihydrolipoamide dehydrogenase (E3) component
MNDRQDLVVVGGGPAGYAAALRAAHRCLDAVALAVELEATLNDVAAPVHAHPTKSESRREAALVRLGVPLHVAAPRGSR